MSTRPEMAREGREQTGSATDPARRWPRASTVAWGLAAAILLVMLVVYLVSMYAGGMNHSTSSDTPLPHDPVVTSVAVPVAEDQMIMPDGSAMDTGQHPGESVAPPVAEDQMIMPDGSGMDMGEHPAESPGAAVTEAADGEAAVTEAGHTEVPTATGDHEMDMGGAVNWYIIGGILAFIAALIAVVTGLKERLARGIATGTLTGQGVSGE